MFRRGQKLAEHLVWGKMGAEVKNHPEEWGIGSLGDITKGQEVCSLSGEVKT